MGKLCVMALKNRRLPGKLLKNRTGLALVAIDRESIRAQGINGDPQKIVNASTAAVDEEFASGFLPSLVCQPPLGIEVGVDVDIVEEPGTLSSPRAPQLQHARPL